MHVHGCTTSHSFCVNLTHFELISHSSEFTNLGRSDLVTEFGFESIDDRPSGPGVTREHPVHGYRYL